MGDGVPVAHLVDTAYNSRQYLHKMHVEGRVKVRIRDYVTRKRVQVKQTLLKFQCLPVVYFDQITIFPQ